MRNILTLIIACLCFAACSKEEAPTQYGNVKLSIEQGAAVFVKSGTSEVSDNYTVATVDADNDAVDALSGTYGSIKDKQIMVPVGNYTVSAYNITETAAETGRGAQRFFGSSPLAVTAGDLENISFTCTMDNARVSFVFDNTFKSLFDINNATNPAKVTASSAANSERKIEYNKDATLAEDDSQIAYFNVSQNDATLNFTITAVRKSDSAVKTYNKSITLQKQSWHQVTIKAATTSGSADISINVNETVTSVTHDIEVDPYN